MSNQGKTYVGIGGWTYEPWRGAFYPDKFPQKRELEYASRHVTSIEVNGTYYGSQKPETFAKWRDETPDDFVFSLKASRFTTNRKVLAEGAKSIEGFLTSGISELKHKLGPINWQFMPTKKFEPDDFEAFLKLLPSEVDGVKLRHAVEVRHDSFRSPDFVALLREYKVASIAGFDAEYPTIADVTAPFVYARLMGTKEGEETGYPATTLDLWAERAKVWALRGSPDGISLLAAKPAAAARDVYLYVISGHKVANPAAAMSLITRLE